MKILMMTDMEGVAGILNHDDWVMPEGRFYDKGTRLLTEEVNAAINGLFEGGATAVEVVDGHGAGGIDPELIDIRSTLRRGRAERVWPWGLEDGFDGLAFVGQHAKAGTPYSHITHTQWFDHIDLSINGISIGEYGQLALCAMELGIPTILACGEQALTEEAQALTPGVETVAIKRGLLPDGLEHLDMDSYRKAKLSAVHLAPRRARELIRAGACAAIERLAADPDSFGYPAMSPPYASVTKYRQRGDTPPRETRAEHATSLIALINGEA